VSKLLETLAAELERPRELPARVIHYICGTYDVDPDAVGSFLINELSKLEDYEIDLILSPVFTPRLADQALFAELLNGDSVPQNQWPGLTQQLAARPTCAKLVTADSQSHSVPLREVTIERYVHRLRLEATIPETILSLINSTPSAEQPMLKAIARRPIWEPGARRIVLERYLATALERGNYSIADALELLNLVENFKPSDIADLLERIPRRKQVLQGEIDAAGGPKPFFSSQVQELHGGGRDQRRQDDARVAAKQNELEFLGRLQQILKTND
jgi:hypothetical protein